MASAAHNTEKTIRVLIADDSAFMRRIIESILKTNPQFEIVGHAKDGREAIALAESLKPDVIIMDIHMPRLDGADATAHIMATNPRPIVVLSSEPSEKNSRARRAMECGAVDYVGKPSSGVDLDMQRIKDDLCRKVRRAAKVHVVRTASLSSAGFPAAPREAKAVFALPIPPRRHEQAEVSSTRFPLVVLASSTGGPATVMRLAPKFTKDFPGAVILVQHMPAEFTKHYAAQLAKLTSIRVKEAESQEQLQPGTFYICPGARHLRITTAGRIHLDTHPARINGYVPNIDVAMASAAAFAGKMAIGVVLTGMGNDGAQGAQAIKRAGGFVLAQNEATSAIFGMPAEAIKTGAVDEVLGIDEIYSAIKKRVYQSYSLALAGTR